MPNPMPFSTTISISSPENVTLSPRFGLTTLIESLTMPTPSIIAIVFLISVYVFRVRPLMITRNKKKRIILEYELALRP